VMKRTKIGIVARNVSVRGKAARLFYPIDEQRRRIRGVDRKTWKCVPTKEWDTDPLVFCNIPDVVREDGPDDENWRNNCSGNRGKDEDWSDQNLSVQERLTMIGFGQIDDVH